MKPSKKNLMTILSFTIVMALSTDVMGQNLQLQTSELSQQITNVARPIFQIISAIIAGAAIFMLGKSVLDAMKGDQGSWTKVGAVFVVGLVWYFVIPSVITWLFAQAQLNVVVK